jgi:DeoR family transcriptional regulator of aga operon
MTDRRNKKIVDAYSSSPHSDGILQELLRSGEVLVDELALQLKVSPSTIRRSLNSLEQQGLLRRTHGGAVPVEPSLYEPFRHVSSFQEQQRAIEKRRIGLAAAALVSDGEIIAIGAGTTTTQVARSIRHQGLD